MERSIIFSRRDGLMLLVFIFIVVPSLFLSTIPEQKAIAARFLNDKSWSGSCIQQSTDDLRGSTDAVAQDRLKREIQKMQEANSPLEMLPPLTVVSSPLFFIADSQFLKSISDARHSYVTDADVHGEERPYKSYSDSTRTYMSGTAHVDATTGRSLQYVQIDWIAPSGWNHAILHGSDRSGGGQYFFVKEHGAWRLSGEEREYDS